MAPTPIQDIDFPALGDKILEFLRALWAFVCDLCIALWSYVTEAFWTVWTYPPFEAFRNEFVATLIALMDYVVTHPIISLAMVVLAHIIVLAVFNTLNLCFQQCLGSGERGMLRGSYAANYQSTSYGGNVRRGSTVARLHGSSCRGAGKYRYGGSDLGVIVDPVGIPSSSQELFRGDGRTETGHRVLITA